MIEVVMTLSLEMDGPRSRADAGELVTQQPWLCNGGAPQGVNLGATGNPG
jgi:hypothetical protein